MCIRDKISIPSGFVKPDSRFVDFIKVKIDLIKFILPIRNFPINRLLPSIKQNYSKKFLDKWKIYLQKLLPKRLKLKKIHIRIDGSENHNNLPIFNERLLANGKLAFQQTFILVDLVSRVC
ncbi:hypothetical protein BpHYR1_014203 [Brachionus plicatilis]|uniref:Uncharacterized protein n=1 Tax=Brachionus plicatilis TaxID=10195 RepID=A0A3M7S9F8_BRAPC|nr:hypothetical protein BpHYR1_014203 [Brachionus plicatilis]